MKVERLQEIKAFYERVEKQVVEPDNSNTSYPYKKTKDLMLFGFLRECLDEIERLKEFEQRALRTAHETIKRTDNAKKLLQELESSRSKLERFKSYVHGRLDKERIPHDPFPDHTAYTKCRIEGRLN